MAKNTQVFTADITLELKGIKEVLVQIKQLQTELNKTVKDFGKGFSIKGGAKAFDTLLKHLKETTAQERELGEQRKQAKADQEAQTKATASAAKVQADFNDQIRRANLLIKESDLKTEKAGVDALNSGMTALKNTLNEVRTGNQGVFGTLQTLQAGMNEVSSATTNLKRGLNIAFSDTSDQYSRVGKVALGLRTALFGVGDATNVVNPRLKQLFGILDRVANSTVGVSRITNSFAAEAQELSSNLVSFNKDVVSSLDNLKKASRTAGLDVTNDLNRITEQARDASKRIQAINNTLLKGGKVKGEDVTAYTSAVALLEKAFQRLDRQGVIPTEASLAKLRAELTKTTDPKQRTQLQAQIKQLEEVKKTYDEIKTSVDTNRRSVQLLGAQTDAASKGSQTAWTKIKGLFIKTVEDIKKAKDATKQTGDAMFLAGKQTDAFGQKTSIVSKGIETMTKSASTFRDVMMGTFAGNLLFAGISNIGRMVTDFISTPFKMAIGYIQSLKDEFISANNTVQNFDVTLRQMLTGFDADQITKAMKGANDYILKVIAKTPFELATGQAAFQQLITGGLDPRQWLEPAADAAAAFNKPMEQLIFAIQRLKAGSKGIGVDMIRDFGIPVQQVGVWINETTGELASFQDVNTKTEQELQASGYAFKKWGFDAAGSLNQTPIEAINILNGYLKQNAVVAGASAARSRTLTGVLSNMKDAVTTLLTAFGQPIFKAVTDILGDIYGVINEIITVAEPFAKLIGEGLAKSFSDWWQALTGIPPILETTDAALKSMNEQLRADKFKELANNILTYVKPALQAILLLVRGDWSKAWGVFLNLAKQAIQGVGKFLQTTGKDAFKWGVSFVTMIAKGLASAAKSVLSFAVKSIASTISSFLKPGSPPEEGPLHTIDQWGKGLIKTFGDGFKSADFSFMQEALAPIKDFFLQKNNVKAYSAIRDTVATIIKGINKTGSINEELWAKVEKRLGKANKEMAQYLRAELQLKAVTKEYEDAEKSGFVSQELQDRLDAAQTLVQLRKEEMELVEQQKQKEREGKQGKASGSSGTSGEEKVDYKKAYQDEVKFLEKKKAIGLVTEEEYLNELQGLNKQYAETALQAGDTDFAKQLADKAKGLQKKIDDARNRQALLDLQKQVAQEKKILEFKYKNGLITEQEYREGLMKIQENYVDQLLQMGYTDLAEKELGQLKQLQTELKKLTDIPMDDPSSLLGSFADDLSSGFDDMIAQIESDLGSVATSTWEDLRSTFSETFTPVWDELKSEISNSLGGLFGEESFSASTLLDSIKGMVSELWTWFAGDEGPLSDLTEMLNQVSTSFLTWADGEGKELLNSVGLKVGTTIKDGIYGAFGINGEGANVGNFVVTLFKAVFSLPDAITGLVVSFLKGVFDGAFGPGLEAWKGVISRIFDPEILRLAMTRWIQNAAINIPTLFETLYTRVTETVGRLVGTVKDFFYNLYMQLVGGSIVPDMVNGMIEWLTVTMPNSIMESLPLFIQNVITKFSELVSGIEFLDIPGKIVGIFEGMYTRMLEAGGKLIENLKTGIQNNLPSLEGIVQFLTQTGIRDYFPFSPAKKGPLSQPINWDGYINTGLNKALKMASKTVNDSLGEMTNALAGTYGGSTEKSDGSRLNQPLGGGFGNYGKNQKGPNFSGGIAQAWKNFFSKVRNGTSNLAKQSYGSSSSSTNLKGQYTGPQARVPKFADGAWKIKASTLSYIHKGEMVIPKNYADKIRSSVGKPSGGNSQQFNRGAFEGAFPNVKDGKDVVDALSKVMRRADLKGSVV